MTIFCDFILLRGKKGIHLSIEDQNYQAKKFNVSCYKHNYGDFFTLLHNPLALDFLAKLSEERLPESLKFPLLKLCYWELFSSAVNLFFKQKKQMVETRMQNQHPKEAVFTQPKLFWPGPIIFCALARAGLVPSQILYEQSLIWSDEMKPRQDFIFANRKTDPLGQQVIGVDFSGSKIGGPIDSSIIFFPDPMGATGHTLAASVQHYKEKLNPSSQAMFVALHLVVTPEYLAYVSKVCPELKVVALRLDRGLSASNILKQEFGKSWSEERGLNDKSYIVPGMGGVGELLNNAQE